MSNPAPVPLYSVDTSSFMDWQARYYPSDIFPALASEIETLIAENRLRSPELVRDEIKAVGTAALNTWAKTNKGIVVTQETTAAEKRNPARSHYIPNVCRELGLPCISLLGMMRREKWMF